MALLPAIAVIAAPVPGSGGLPRSLPAAGLALAAAQSPAATTDNAAAKTPFGLASLWPPTYLHAEAWGSESLPLNAAVKAGFSRIYLTLGVATGPFGRQSGGVAGGVGLGTVGQARGRFTPSLDLMQWFVSGVRETPGSQLTQLRPLLAWQIKPNGRLQLFGGPTLNLATGHREDVSTREGLGQDQWLWLDSSDEHAFVRLWPGVQLGLRF